jgi:hypothetical protein
MNYNDFINKLQNILDQHKAMAESGTDIKAGVDIKQELIKYIDDFLYPNPNERIDRAFKVASDREQLGIDFEMNMNSLKQDLEEIKIEEEMKNTRDDLSKLEGGLDIVNEKWRKDD